MEAAMSKKIKPLGNRVVIKRSEAKATKGGILLPETAKEKPKQGEIVAVGTGRVDEKGKNHPLDVKVGQQILFSSYAGAEYKMDDVDYLILSEEDILAVVGG
jgi:chaperonin GroES